MPKDQDDRAEHSAADLMTGAHIGVSNILTLSRAWRCELGSLHVSEKAEDLIGAHLTALTLIAADALAKLEALEEMQTSAR